LFLSSSSVAATIFSFWEELKYIMPALNLLDKTSKFHTTAMLVVVDL
jgi:hypothetical protein